MDKKNSWFYLIVNPLAWGMWIALIICIVCIFLPDPQKAFDNMTNFCVIALFVATLTQNYYRS